MDLEDYIKMANMLKDIRVMMHAHIQEIGPKTKPFARHWRKALKAVGESASKLEDCMILQFPSVVKLSTMDWTNIFYNESIRMKPEDIRGRR